MQIVAVPYKTMNQIEDLALTFTEWDVTAPSS
jgi:hypothetical protein